MRYLTDASYYDVCVCTVIAGWFMSVIVSVPASQTGLGAWRVYDWRAVLSVTGQPDTGWHGAQRRKCGWAFLKPGPAHCLIHIYAQ